MNEVSQLNQLVSEIKFFENQAMTNYWEIGKRLNQAKEQVPHGEWGNWIKENLDYSIRSAQRLIRIYEETPNTTPVSHLPLRKQLALITLEEDDRKAFVESNDIDSMSSRQLEAEIRKHHMTAEELEKVNLENIQLRADLLKKEDQKIKVEEVIKEVVPSDYEALKAQQIDNSQLISHLKESVSKKESEFRALKEQHQKTLRGLPENEQLEKVKLDVYELIASINNFIKKTGGLLYLIDYVNDLKPNDRKGYIKAINHLSDFSNQLKFNLERKEHE